MLKPSAKQHLYARRRAAPAAGVAASLIKQAQQRRGKTPVNAPSMLAPEVAHTCDTSDGKPPPLGGITTSYGAAAPAHYGRALLPAAHHATTRGTTP